MDATTFNDKAYQAYTQAIAEHGMTGSHLDNYSAYGLQAIDDGKYLVTLGNSFLTDPKGNTVVIDMNQQPSIADQAKPVPVSKPEKNNSMSNNRMSDK